MSILDAFGVNNASTLSNTIDDYQQQNASIGDILGIGSSIPRTLGGIPAIGSRIPGISNIEIPGISALDKLVAPINQINFGKSGTWESLQYADDLNYHHPKLKFLFKVGFYGFDAGRDFYYYVLKADKPRVNFIHQDVNYYNFRSRVLTGVTYDPISITFFDEIGNTLNDFFVTYLKQRSGTGSGKYGIEQGFGEATSSKPYGNGYSQTNGQRVIVEQVFANGTQSNRFIFINPRIEKFDFDDLSMDESNIGSHGTVTFSYDAIECVTVYGSTIHSWGNVDLLRGGGTSGEMNGGSTSGVGPGTLNNSISDLYDSVRTAAETVGNLPNALVGMALGTQVNTGSNSILGGAGSAIRTVSDTISQGVQGTLKAITSGANMIFGGKR